MALSNALRRASSSLAPLAICALLNQRVGSFSILNPSNNGSFSWEFCRSTFGPAGRFSSSSRKSSSDQDLLRVIDSEIRCAEDDRDSVVEVPDGFPFEIQDNPRERTVSLSREYQGEIINLEVHMPDFVDGDNENDDNEENDNKNAEDGGESSSSIALVVSISKGDGTGLEFGCTAYPDDISIDSLIVKKADASEDQDAYEGPEFTNLDENLQKALHKYLEIRGIKPSTTNFLHEYMVKKDSREYLMWLQDVRKFIEKKPQFFPMKSPSEII